MMRVGNWFSPGTPTGYIMFSFGHVQTAFGYLRLFGYVGISFDPVGHHLAILKLYLANYGLHLAISELHLDISGLYFAISRLFSEDFIWPF